MQRDTGSEASTVGMAAATPIRVLVADEQHVVRRGIRSLLESRPNFEVVAEAADGANALAMLAATGVDVAIVDYALSVMNGLQLTRHIRAASPETEVLIFTMHESEALVRAVLKAGARGYLLKSDGDVELVAAVEALSRHQPYFTNQVNQTILSRYLSLPDDVEGSTALTPRETEVVQLIADGHSSKGIGRVLGIGLKTVETHRASAMHKVGASTTAALVRYAVRNKLVEP